MSRIGKIARRTFLVGAVAVAGGVAFGVWAVRRPAPNPLRPGDGETALSPFVVIDAEGVLRGRSIDLKTCEELVRSLIDAGK